MQCELCGGPGRPAVTRAPGGAKLCHPCGLVVLGYLRLQELVGLDGASRAFARAEIGTDDDIRTSYPLIANFGTVL